MSQPCTGACPLSETLIAEVSRLTGVNEDVVRIARGLPVHHQEGAALRRVVIEVPHGGDAGYERAAFLDSVNRGEAPVSATALQGEDGELEPLDARRIREVWGRYSEATVVYADLGVTAGMQAAVDDARLSGRDVEIRHLGVPWAPSPRRRATARVAVLGR
ncbi:MAG: hypothetical protein KJ792_13925 [Actinobacteria bacterium]|nr:hypothetical protein [Actinomycetota bacterium]MCG2800998.1 hypothetical protein [Cellulomonas sp.]